VSDDQVVADCEAAARWLRSLPTSNGKVGILGTCSGGRHALLVASRTKSFDAVIDLWGGFADPEKTRPWRRDTLVNVYSTTKGIVALAAHVLADRGQLDLDAPVARYWPEFTAAGKETMPVRHLLTHQAGLAAIRTPLESPALVVSTPSDLRT